MGDSEPKFETYQDVRSNLARWSTPVWLAMMLAIFLQVLPPSHRQTVSGLFPMLNTWLVAGGALVGASLAAYYFFGFEPALGRPLKVNDQWLTVVGVLEGGGGKREIQGVTLEGTANDIYLPATAAERRFGRAPLKAPLDELVVSMAPGTPVQESAAVVSTLLDRLHSGAADYTITMPEALLEQSHRTQRLFDIVMGTIAGISLLVGGIGIMNIMLATVLEGPARSGCGGRWAPARSTSGTSS